MKSFLLRCALFLALLAGLLWMLTYITDSDLHRRQTGPFQTWNEAASGQLNADILILGSSHAHVQIDPAGLQHIWPGLKIYNAGIDGYTWPVHLAWYRFYRRFNKQPQVIILNVDYQEFSKSALRINPLQFLPFTNDSSVRRALHEMDMPWPRVQVPFLKYRGEANALLAALRPSQPLPGEYSKCAHADGFMPVEAHWDEALFLQNPQPDEAKINLDSSVWHSFLHFKKACFQKGIQLITVFTPHYSRISALIPEGPAYRAWLRHNIEPEALFVDCASQPYSNDTAFFYNSNHLNARGAAAFTQAFADSLSLLLPARANH